MAERSIDVPSVGNVSFRKRRGSKSVRLKVDTSGQIVVTLPYFVPYKVAIEFVKKHSEWITIERNKQKVQLNDGMSIGRVHTLRFIYEAHVPFIKTRVTGNEILIRHNTQDTDPAVQAAAMVAARRALRAEASQFLPKRLQDIATSEGYSYNGVSIKQMRGRWGSCNQDNHITLNIFLMGLPIQLIDYVILHELAHTRALHHGPAFWGEFEQHLPDAKRLRKQMRQYQPTIPAQRVP
jgi:predicted metal-dependent hydrolase